MAVWIDRAAKTAVARVRLPVSGTCAWLPPCRLPSFAEGPCHGCRLRVAQVVWLPFRSSTLLSRQPVPTLLLTAFVSGIGLPLRYQVRRDQLKKSHGSARVIEP